MELFEGYTGIRWGNELLVHDVFLLVFIVLLAVFAFVFHTCYPLFYKMIRGFVSIKERQTLFDEPTKENFFFTGFMGFQTVFLCAIFFYYAYCHFTQSQPWAYFSDFILLALFFIILLFFYLLKQCLYFMYGRLIVGNEKFKLWQTIYQSTFNIWGILLYLPVLWLIFDKNHFTGVLILFGFSYILFRFHIIYIKFRIFYHKYTGLLYFSLYLCAQEIVPLLFLYESLNYLHNVIETSVLWQ